jgi:fatty-acyl-CoA synthase
MPKRTSIDDLPCYEELIDRNNDDFSWHMLVENSASSMCYTSGTTGKPKGTLYSHWSTPFHSYATIGPNAFGISARDVVMPAVPMFHVNAEVCLIRRFRLAQNLSCLAPRWMDNLCTN